MNTKYKYTATSRIHINHSLKTSDSHKKAELGQGQKREDFQNPLPQEYLKAFEEINADKNQELIVVENENAL